VRTVIVPLLAASVALAGCAKKSFVQREVGEVNKKVDAVSAEVEKTQQRVQQNEVRIDAVDKSAQSGISEAKGSAQSAMTKAQDAEKAAKGKAEISDEAKAMIDEAVAPLVQANRGVFFEIEGHTDSTGDAAYNFKLGEERAMAVRDYIAKKHGIALSRLNVISYGEEKPVAENKTREERAQNRRVVIRILE
jgi:peptidoglycan-associated lipoprotein